MESAPDTLTVKVTLSRKDNFCEPHIYFLTPASIAVVGNASQAHDDADHPALECHHAILSVDTQLNVWIASIANIGSTTLENEGRLKRHKLYRLFHNSVIGFGQRDVLEYKVELAGVGFLEGTPWPPSWVLHEAAQERGVLHPVSPSSPNTLCDPSSPNTLCDPSSPNTLCESDVSESPQVYDSRMILDANSGKRMAEEDKDAGKSKNKKKKKKAL